MLWSHTRLLFLASICSTLFGQAAWPIYSPPEMNAPKQKEMVRVMLGHFPNLTLSGVDLVVNGSENFGYTSVDIHCEARQIYEGGEPRTGPELISAHGNFIQLNGKLYRGEIQIYSGAQGCTAVNHLDLEKYVAGLLNKEMLPTWPMEALKAQAVASRTYALFQMRVNHGRTFDLMNTTQDQVYEGVSSETAKSNRAAEETHGTVLTWKHSPIKAFFHADCGGRTESPEAVWGEKYGYLRPVICPYHKSGASQKTWSMRASLAQLNTSLHQVAGLLPKNFLRLARLDPGPQNKTGRRNALRLSDQKGTMAIIPANAFRSAMGYTRVRSTAFALKTEADTVEITGHGNGHGVGMCQIGAKAMADNGGKFTDILHFYYPLAKLERLQ